MKNVKKNILLALLLLLALGGLFVTVRVRAGLDAIPAAPVETYRPAPTVEGAPTPEPTPTPDPEYFTISAVGDCTLASSQSFTDSSYGYKARMNGDYAYPFSNTVQYFSGDDFTFANLECCFSDRKLSSIQQFYFLSPTEWAEILVQGGVDFVNTANTHTMDFGQAGADSTYKALKEHGVAYGVEGETTTYITARGLKIGVYCDYNSYYPDVGKSAAAVASLKKEGAEYIICAFHWGKDELKYRPSDAQTELARACVDAGADLVYGSHAHCLQPIEEYNGSIILYGMGNWSFGGHTAPSDPDTAIVQIKVKRDIDGAVTNDGYTVIPCCVSSDLEGAAAHDNYYNDYRPTPYAEGTEEYARAMSKITGAYEGPDGNVDYSDWWASLG